MTDILKIELAREKIEYLRNEIAKRMVLKSSNIRSEVISTISADDIGLLFNQYDALFFDNWFKKCYKRNIKFSVSRRMTKSAGMTILPKYNEKQSQNNNEVEIRIGVDFFVQYDLVQGNKMVCGIKTQNSLEALQLVFEHELCHVIEFIYFKKSSCKGDRFKHIAGNLFGHSESYHKLPTNRQIAVQRFGLKIGCNVSFTFKGENLSGIICNINKRATVLVRSKSGPFVDNKGNRYMKYYVPLTLITREN